MVDNKVIAVGRLEDPKNFASLIRAFKIVAENHPDWALEIFGDGSLKVALQQQIEQLCLTGNVFLRGFTKSVRDEMLSASCFALSSKFEGFSLALLEAMSCGLPAVAYDIYGPEELIDDGKTGFLVAPGNEKQLAEKLCRIIEDDNLRHIMGNAARAKAENYKIENIIPMWMELFNRPVNKGNR